MCLKVYSSRCGRVLCDGNVGSVTKLGPRGILSAYGGQTGRWAVNATGPRVTVALTFDFDAVSPWLQVTTASPSFVSRGEFGPVGVERIRKLLDEFDIKATFFTPGHTALLYPDAVHGLVSDGHEIGHHGWVHEALSPLSEQEERTAIERGLEALDGIGGARPSGFRAPAFDLSHRTIDLLVEYGFSYDSSMMGSDFTPYWCRSGDLASASEPFSFGPVVDVVEVPVSWYLNDVPFFEFVPGVPNLAGGSRPRDVLEIWKDEFTYLHSYVRDGCMVLTLHPQSTGRGHRLLLLREFVEFILGHSGVEFIRADYLASRFRDEAQR
jgi:peptidoglycan/xylan/chitin deacetylase (PgdA/CDA1 family)